MINKLNILLLSNKFGIGGGERKVKIFNEGLNKIYFNKFFVFFEECENIFKKEEDNYFLSEDKLLQFIEENNVQIFYDFTQKISDKVLKEIKKKCIFVKNINFVSIYDKSSNDLNLIISKTINLKLKYIYGNLVNSYVVYNPINTKKWIELSKNKNSYKDFLKNKNIKLIVGRLGRSEPSKWSFLIIATLFRLNREKNLKFGFIFVGMPFLYKYLLQLCLSRTFLDNILFLPQTSNIDELGKFYNSLDIFWQASSVGETFGNVIVESFCFKVPVITDFKDFRNKYYGFIKKNYDLCDTAQMELVDHMKNGFHINYPSIFIDVLERLNKKNLIELGDYAFKKAKEVYDVSNASKTMEKIFYEKARERKFISKIPDYYKQIEFYPNLKEVSDYEKEYIQRLKVASRFNKISFFDKLFFNLFQYLWNLIVYIYLIFRFILRRFNIDIEKKEIFK